MANRQHLTKTPATHKSSRESLVKTIPITTRVQRSTLESLSKFAKERGMLSVQEVVRLAISSFLEKSGY